MDDNNVGSSEKRPVGNEAEIPRSKKGRTASSKASIMESKIEVQPTAVTSALEAYLKIGKSITTLTLPKQTDDLDYPALAVDAASGTGKTQQAFAFLAQGHEIVYFICATSYSQPIYNDMSRKVSGMDTLRSCFKRYAEKLDESKMSIESLKKSISKIAVGGESVNEVTVAVNALVRSVYRCLIRMSPDSTTIEMASTDSKGASFEHILKSLKHKILFADEAIPAAAGTQKQGSREAFLRLVRNIARALEMRAVMAGTASCLPNLSYLPTMMRASHASRSSSLQTKWMECCLYWQPMKTDALPTFQRDVWRGESVTSILEQHRPLFLLMLKTLEDQMPHKGVGNLLSEVGIRLEGVKEITPSSMFHWLSGAWLEGDRKVPSAFNTMAPALVRGHFFEPGITVVSNSGSNNSKSTKPYLGTGISCVSRVTGPRMLQVDRYKIRSEPWWSISNFAQTGGTAIAAQTQKNTSLTRSHHEILGSLTTCVQQCLVREPLLAVAMSFAHSRLDPPAFKKSVSEGVSKFVAQQLVGCVSEEINEHICFAALQLASLRSVSKSTYTPATYTPVEVHVFLSSLFQYFDVQSDEATLDPDEATLALPSFFAQDGEVRQQFVGGMSLDNLLTDGNFNWQGVTVPMLIPASSKEALQVLVQQNPTLFDGLPIAGLVPGTTNARFDATAYEWKQFGKEEPFDSCWNFEFKVFSGDYTTEKAKKDLDAKCKGANQNCHALLIAFRPGGKPDLHVGWEGKYLRIVALFQTAP